ncbi:MAG: CAP domain-containing protein [Clostridiales bacterium]|nr:CAP domain-containing protein [Clostridiales bacterium]
MAKAVLTLINNEREANGLGALSWGGTLAKAADIRATELVVSFSHTRPDGSDWWTAGAQLQMGENLAFGQTSASEVVAAWMNSPTHRDNILNSYYSSLGVSCYYCNGTYYWVQEFA